jgi:hypothetical protein
LHPLLLIALIVAAAAGWTMMDQARNRRSSVDTSSPFRPETTGGDTSGVVIPRWVPIYPGAKVTGGTSKQTRTESYLWFTITTSDPCQQVINFYENQLNLAGFNVVKGTNDGEGCMGVLQSQGAGGMRSVNLTGGATASGTRFGVEVVQRHVGNQLGSSQGGVERDSNAAAENRIPRWVPVYPRWTPQNFSARQSGPEYFLSFSFTTSDEIKQVLSWYQEKLRQAGFRVDLDVVGSSGALWSNTPDNRRSLGIKASSVGPQNVLLLEVRDHR